MTLTALQALLAAWITVDTFRRLIKVNARTVAAVRHAFAVLFTASICLTGTTVAGITVASWPTILLLAGVLAVQLATARYWRRGPPAAFQETAP